MWCCETKVQTLLAGTYARHTGRSAYTFTESHLGKRVVMCRWKDYSSHKLLFATSFMPASPLKHWARWGKLTTKDQTKEGVIRILLFLSRLTHIIGRWGKGLWAVIKVSNIGITSAPTLTAETRQPRTGKNLLQIIQFFTLYCDSRGNDLLIINNECE